MEARCGCGALLEEGQTFCRHCGKPVSDHARQERPTDPLPGDRGAATRPPQPGPGGSRGKLVAAGVAVFLAAGAGAFFLFGASGDDETGADRAGSSKANSNEERKEVDPEIAELREELKEIRAEQARQARQDQPEPAPAPATGGGEFSSGFIAQLGSFTKLGGAETQRARLQSQGTQAEILRSDDYAEMVPGYWVVFTGPFSSQGAAEQSAAASGVSDAFARFVSRG